MFQTIKPQLADIERTLVMTARHLTALSGYGKLMQSAVINVQNAHEHVVKSCDLFRNATLDEYVAECESWIRLYEFLKAATKCQYCCGSGERYGNYYVSPVTDDCATRQEYGCRTCGECGGYGFKLGRRKVESKAKS
jgi:hypothetical protein